MSSIWHDTILSLHCVLYILFTKFGLRVFFQNVNIKSCGYIIFVVCHINNKFQNCHKNKNRRNIIENKIEQSEKSSAYGENHTTKQFKSSKYQ